MHPVNRNLKSSNAVHDIHDPNVKTTRMQNGLFDSVDMKMNKCADVVMED